MTLAQPGLPTAKPSHFLRRGRSDEGELFLISATGGSEHKIGDTRNQELLREPGRALSISWSPDGKGVAASHRESGEAAESIFLFSRTADRRRLTTPSPEHYGDQAPAFSPDGRTLAFSRLRGFRTSEIYSIPLRVSLGPHGDARRLTAHDRWSAHPVWSQDGRKILYVFGEDLGDTQTEIRLIEGSGAPKFGSTAPLHNNLIWDVSIGGRRLVYSRQIHDQEHLASDDFRSERSSGHARTLHAFDTIGRDAKVLT